MMHGFLYYNLNSKLNEIAVKYGWVWSSMVGGSKLLEHPWPSPPIEKYVTKDFIMVWKQNTRFLRRNI